MSGPTGEGFVERGMHRLSPSAGRRPTTEPLPRYRTGRSIGRTIYEIQPDGSEVCVGLLDTQELARKFVDAVNARAAAQEDVADETRAQNLHTVWVEPWPDRGEYDIAVRHERDGAVWTAVGEGVGEEQIQADAARWLIEEGWRLDGPWKRVGQALRAPVIPDTGA